MVASTAVGGGLALFLDKETVARRLAADVAFGCRFYRALAISLADRLRKTARRTGAPARPTLTRKPPLRPNSIRGSSAACQWPGAGSPNCSRCWSASADQRSAQSLRRGLELGHREAKRR